MEELRRLNNMQAHTQQQVQDVVQQTIEASFYSGPVPEPEMMERFEHISPGSADRMWRMAEKQMDHRHYVERRRTDTEAFQRIGGLISATLLGLVVSVGGLWLIDRGHSIAGYSTLIGAAAVFAGAFLTAFAAKRSPPVPNQQPRRHQAGQLELPLRR